LKLIVCILASLGIIASGNLHDFHLSKTEVNYKTDQKALQITLHTFIDDTEKVLKTYEELEYKFFESKEHPATDSIFYSYLLDHLVVKVDGAEVDYYYLGKEQSDDIMGIYAYLEVEGVEAFETIEISNSLLMDIFDDQRNILNFKVDNKSKAFHIFSVEDYSKLIKL